MEAIISDLNSASNYSIQVAAVNSAGTGVYSAVIYTITKGNIFMQNQKLCIVDFIIMCVIIKIYSYTGGFRPLFIESP